MWLVIVFNALNMLIDMQLESVIDISLKYVVGLFRRWAEVHLDAQSGVGTPHSMMHSLGFFTSPWTSDVLYPWPAHPSQTLIFEQGGVYFIYYMATLSYPRGSWFLSRWWKRGEKCYIA